MPQVNVKTLRQAIRDLNFAIAELERHGFTVILIEEPGGGDGNPTRLTAAVQVGLDMGDG